MDWYWILIGLATVAVLIGALWLLLWLAARVAVGAHRMLVFALEQGFSGIVAFFAAWVFLFPVMLVWAAVWGWLVLRGGEAGVHAPTRSTKEVHPPSDPDERFKWANRLPPYDD